MVKKVRKKIAGILIFILMGVVATPGNVVASEVISDVSINEDTESNVSPDMKDREIIENTEEETTQQIEEESLENNQIMYNMEEETESTTIASPGLINYVGVEVPYLEAPAEQKLVVSFGVGTENVSDVKLICEKSDGDRLEFDLYEKEKEVYLFKHSFTDGDVGVYRLVCFTYRQDGIDNKIDLTEIGIEAMFGVNEIYPGCEVNSEDVTRKNVENIDISVVEVDADKVEYAEMDVEKAIEETVESIEVRRDSEKKSESNMSKAVRTFVESAADTSASTLNVKSADDIVVVLDPGHGGYDGGATGHGLMEKDLTLKIAQACKNELEQYNDVDVYMTRDTDVYVGLSERVRRAKEWGADVFVSIHINSSEQSGGNGAEVWYPNSNYNPTIHNQGKELSKTILKQLTALGLADRGIKIKDSTNGSKYPDGSLMDYYTVIHESKTSGFPGIIVEHAFISNASDAAKLADDQFLGQLGEADATGIAKYFDLAKGPSIKINNKNDFAGTAQIKVAGLGSNATVRIQNEETKETKDYLIPSGKETLKFNINDFKNLRGSYKIEARNTSGNLLCDASFYVAETESVISLQIDKLEKQCVVKIEFKDMPSEVTEVKVPTWQAEDQKDLIWYDAKQISDGEWQTVININDFKKSGKYHLDVYAALPGGRVGGLEGLGSGYSFEVSQPSMKAAIQNYDVAAGTFEVVLTDIQSRSGIDKIQVPVWCAEDQSDIRWYEARKQNDGTYKVIINISDYNYTAGSYKVHAYLYAKNGISFGMIVGEQKVSLPNVGIFVRDIDNKDTRYELKVTNIGCLGNVKDVQFAVWSEKGGQDDLIWYKGSKKGSGEWVATADIRQHKTEGNYQVHVYATLVDGKLIGVGTNRFTVTDLDMNVLIQNYDKDNGTFEVLINGIKSQSGVDKVQVPVWCAKDQSDIHWYEAVDQKDGSYKVTVSMSNHGYAIGNYQVHAYLKASNGMILGKEVGEQKVILPNVTISASDVTGKNMEYVLRVSNVEVLGVVKSIQFATWSDKGGQDDLIWYSGSKNESGEWTAIAKIKKHMTAGRYNVHVYATLANGMLKGLGMTTFEVASVDMNTSIQNYDKSKGTFEVRIDAIQSQSGIDKIQVPVWCAEDQSDIYWYDASEQSDGSYKAIISMAKHKFSTGKYKVHAYLTAGNGISIGKIVGEQIVIIPEFQINANDTYGKERNYTLRISNVELLGLVKNVQFAVWSEQDGQNDLIWYNASRNQGEWTAIVDIKNHKSAGKYNVHVYATLANGMQRGVGKTTFEVSRPSVASIEVQRYDENTGMFQLVLNGVQAVSGISKIQVPVWSSEDQRDIHWYTAVEREEGVYTVNVDPVYHNYSTGLYQIHVYIETANGLFENVGSYSQEVGATRYYTIMGPTTTTVEQMMKYYESGKNEYPALALGAGGAGTLEQFCKIFVEEANEEGVRAEVAFTQAMKETGWLRFGNIVKIEQFNFAGLGALDGNLTGECASFRDVREGVRAQIQHLKAYGSTDALNNECVDPRFDKVPERGCAQYVEWLGQQENPKGYGWATEKNYGTSIVNMIKKLKMS